MNYCEGSADERSAEALLRAWIARRTTPEGAEWLVGAASDIANDASARRLGAALAAVPRRVGRAPLALAPDDLARAASARAGWMPARWSADQAARVLLLAVAGRTIAERAGDAGAFVARLREIARTSDVAELVALYRGLPLYPEHPDLATFAAEGLRTAMRPVFEAVAHANPFPAERFSEQRWNQMVLKALFIESALAPIAGLDRRWNATLARTLRDYAHERWAAGRPVSPELWRGIGPFADAEALADLESVLANGTPPERAAAALALTSSDDPAAGMLLATQPALAAEIREGRLTWETLGER